MFTGIAAVPAQSVVWRAATINRNVWRWCECKALGLHAGYLSDFFLEVNPFSCTHTALMMFVFVVVARINQKSKAESGFCRYDQGACAWIKRSSSLTWSVHGGGGGTTGPLHQHNICMIVCDNVNVHYRFENDLPGINCWVVRWEESPADCGASERIPSLTWGNSTSKSPCGARTDADDAQMKWFKQLNSLQSGASCVFLLHLASRCLWLLVKIITL